jgi:hypothetical protein
LLCGDATGSAGSHRENKWLCGGQAGALYPGGGGAGRGPPHAGGAHGQSSIANSPYGPWYRIGMLPCFDCRRDLVPNKVLRQDDCDCDDENMSTITMTTI